MDMNASSSAQFYSEFKDAGFSATIITLNASKSVIAIIGIVLNVSLVAVTIVSKSLHGSCNILLAIDSFGYALYLISPLISLAIALSGLNFVPLSLCFLLQTVPMFGLNISFCMMLFIASERLLSISFPFWSNRIRPTFYLPAILLVTMLVAVSNLYRLYMASLADGTIMVMCTITDCYRGEAGQQIYASGLVSILISIACYLAIWAQMRRKMSQGKVDATTRRLFKSLVVIIVIIVCGWMLDILARLALPLLSSSLSALSQLALSNFFSNCAFIAAASNAPVLYAFSRDYRAAYNAALNRVATSIGINRFHLDTVAVVAITSQIVANKTPQKVHAIARQHSQNSGNKRIPNSSAGTQRTESLRVKFAWT